MGSSGVGKSALMSELALEDIKAHRGVIYFDLFGTSVEGILPNIPRELENKTFYLNFGSVKNVLDLPTKEDFHELIRTKQILLVDFELQKIGPEKLATYAKALIDRLLAAAQEQYTMRKDIYVYLDELQQFQSPALIELLTQAEQLHLNLHVAHQFKAQLEEQLITKMSQVLDSRLWFKMKDEDIDWIAELESKQLAQLVRDLDNFQFVLDAELETGKRSYIKANSLSTTRTGEHRWD